MLVHIGIDKIDKHITISNNRDSLPAVHSYRIRDFTWHDIKRIVNRLTPAGWTVKPTN